MASSDDNMDETMKYKVRKVLEMHPNKNKHEVLLVLEYYSGDVDTAVNAYTEGNVPDSLKSNHNSANNKNKRKKKKNKKASLAGTTQLSDGNQVEPASVTVVKGEPDDDEEYEASPRVTVKETQPKSLPDASERTRAGDSTENKISSSQNGDLNKSHNKYPSAKPKSQNPLRESSETLTNKSPDRVNNQLSDNSPRDDSKSLENHGASPKKAYEFAKPLPKNRHRSSGSFSQSRTTSLSEETSSQASATGSAYASQGKTNLEKSMKDLSRQTVALTRVNNILEDELDNSYRRIKHAVAEVQKLLDDRTVGLEQEMEKVKKDARALLSQRKELALELKQRAERSSTLTEAELNELRADIKHFVVERKYDDELGKTLRFVWDKDRITEEIRSFGEIHHVKNCYSQRRQSVSSVASSTCQTSSVLESPSDHQIPILADSKEGTNQGSSHDQPSDTRPHNSNSQFQGRSRVFFSSSRNYYHGPNSDYGGGNNAGNSNSGTGSGGAAAGGGTGQTRPNFRHYPQQRGGRGGHFEPRGNRGGRGYYNKFNNQRYPNSNNNNSNANQQADTEETSNRRPPPRRGGRNPRFQNHNQGRSYQHHNNNNSNYNANATASNPPAPNETSKEVRGNANGDNKASAVEASNPALVNGYVGH